PEHGVAQHQPGGRAAGEQLRLAQPPPAREQVSPADDEAAVVAEEGQGGVLTPLVAALVPSRLEQRDPGLRPGDVEGAVGDGNGGGEGGGGGLGAAAGGV